MSKSLGRRHRQQNALADAPDLTPDRAVMRVAAVCGENTYELEAGDGARALYSLPSRLRHVVFIRPGSFVLGRLDAVRAAKGKLRGDIDAVVLDVHLPAMRKHPRWPPRFGKRSEGPPTPAPLPPPADARDGANDGSSESEVEQNPNRRKADMYSDSDSDSDSEGVD